MKKFSVIIIDEAHEKSLSSDILLSMSKDLIIVREDLRLVVSSATLNAEILKDYFLRYSSFENIRKKIWSRCILNKIT